MKHLKILAATAVAALGLTAFLGSTVASAETTDEAVLEKNTTPSANDVLSNTAHIEISMEAGTSATFRNTSSSLQDTCTSTIVTANLTQNATDPHGTVSTLDNGAGSTPCSETTDTVANGELTIKHIAGTTNGTVIGSGTEVTVNSTIFGISCKFRTGTGVSLGTLTGAGHGLSNATMDVNAVISSDFCGSGIWEGSYVVTDPTGLTVEH